jgi:hypothetical protein
MGQTTIPAATAGATRNVQIFTSSTTWTVPTSAKYVDVLVVGGGCGGSGGYRRTSVATQGAGSYGGAVVIAKDFYLGGTGTVTVTVGSGSNGVAGVATTTNPSDPSSAGFSGFGTIYAGGATSGNPGIPGYKGSTVTNVSNYTIYQDTTQSNFGPSILPASSNAYQSFANNNSSVTNMSITLGLNVFGIFGGGRGGQVASGTTTNSNVAGTSPGNGDAGGSGQTISTNTITQNIPSTWLTSSGSATAGTVGASGSAAGAAGITGIAGGGGTCFWTGGVGGQGGPGGGGGGSMPNPVGGNGGNGGNAGANTGGGGGTGANTGSGTAGTGGSGGNGGSGLVVVSWIS